MSRGRPGHSPVQKSGSASSQAHKDGTRCGCLACCGSQTYGLYVRCHRRGSFKSGRQVSAVGLSPSPEVTPASDVCQSAVQDSQRFAGFAPDTWWPPDLQNVSQGQCGREAGRGQPWAGSCRQPDGASGAQLHPTPHCTALFPKHHFALQSNAF